MANWPDYLSEEYSCAVVRLAAVLEKGKLHLVFACVEFYPTEAPSPPLVPLEKRNLGDARLYFGIYKMSCAEALRWYEDAAQGNPIVPDTKQAIVSTPLGSEPMLGRLVSANDIPFAATWHGGSRINRLVPLSDLDPSVSQFIATEQSENRQKVAREWLAERLHFDVLARDDWLGGVGLLIPNPVVRSFRMTVFPDASSGRETVRAIVEPRQDKSMASLAVTFRELRFDALATVETVRVDPYGRAELPLPETTREIAVELHCDQRGLLSVERPAGFVRSIQTNLEIASGAMAVEVPSARSGGQTTVYRRHVRSSSRLTTGSSSLPNTVSRLIDLNQRQARRSGEARPNSLWRGAQIDEAILFDDRLAAADFIRGLIARARTEVVLVDPFFDHISLREFGIATSYENMSVRILLGREHLRNTAPLPDEKIGVTGDILLAEIGDLRDRAQDYRLSVPNLRLMGGDCRKYHDRFLILDSDVWHCGHSFNQVGRAEVSMMTRLRHPQKIRSEILFDLEKGEDFQVIWQQQTADAAQTFANRIAAWMRSLITGVSVRRLLARLRKTSR